MPIDSERPILSVVIVSYNTRAMTLDCLRTLFGEPGAAGAEVLVVDNASADGSAEAIRAEFPAARVILNERNAGFGAANNLAMAQARGRYFLLLNTDAFPLPGAVAGLIDFLDKNPDVGVAGPRLLNRDGSLQQSCFRCTTPAYAWLENLGLLKLMRAHPAFDDYRAWDHASERDVEFVIGACLLVRREVYEKVGGFDERFFMYQEEADWEKRIKEAGWRIVFTPSAVVTHLGGASGLEQPAKISRHFFESLDTYMVKHHGRLGAMLVRAAMLVGCSVRALAWGAAAALPAQRQRARGKARLHAWLVQRQLRTPLPSLNSP